MGSGLKDSKALLLTVIADIDAGANMLKLIARDWRNLVQTEKNLSGDEQLYIASIEGCISSLKRISFTIRENYDDIGRTIMTKTRYFNFEEESMREVEENEFDTELYESQTSDEAFSSEISE